MPRAKVHLLPGIAAPRAKVRQDAIVEMLTDLVKQAKRGEIQGLAVMYVSAEDGVITDWESGKAPSNTMVAGISRLWFRMMEAANG